MKKLISLLFIIAIAWLIKLSYDFYQVSQQVTAIQETLHKNEQKNANLNDQVVAIQRQVPETPEQNSAIQKKHVDIEKPKGLSPLVVIKQQLQLVQFALQQQQFVFAIEQLTQLDQTLEQYELASALKQSLHQAIADDKQSIQQFVLARNGQQEQLDGVLQQIDQSIEQEIHQPTLSPAKVAPTHFWQKWLQIDVVDHQSPTLANRQFILKEAQLRVLLAKQALNRGQNLEYQTMLNQVVQQLNQLPDAKSQQLKQKILRIKQIQMLPVPKLNSMAILG